MQILKYISLHCTVKLSSNNMFNMEVIWWKFVINYLFNNQTGHILVHIYPLFDINLHVKYRSNIMIWKKTFWFIK